MQPEDRSFSLKDPVEMERRKGMLSHPHMEPLTQYLERLRSDRGIGRETPDFDPCDGGIRAKLLFLLEAPGPRAVGSSFVSRNNPDQTARNMNSLLQDSLLPRADTILWNIVPWYVGNGRKIRKVTPEDIEQATPYLSELVALLPNLEGIVLVGKNAQSARNIISCVTNARIFEAPHPSPQAFNVYPYKREEARAVFLEASAFIKSRQKGPALSEAKPTFPAIRLLHQRIGSVSNSHVGADFEDLARKFFALQGIDLLPRFPLGIGLSDLKGIHRFDLGSESPKIIVECKSHRWTASGLVPSAKMAVWNEAMYYFLLAPRDYRKIFFVLHDRRKGNGESLLSYYRRTRHHLIPEGVEFIEWDESANGVVGIERS
ncbi:MAG: uracil-DNA glycosylase [Akkermansiaceae bacterium]|nr:uracil-DNA glycosylase [Akkermansiaceae bacterium]